MADGNVRVLLASLHAKIDALTAEKTPARRTGKLEVPLDCQVSYESCILR